MFKYQNTPIDDWLEIDGIQHPPNFWTKENCAAYGVVWEADPPPPPPTPEQVAMLAQVADDENARTLAKQNAVIQYLATHTPLECAAKVQSDVTNLATAKDMLANFAMALCVLARDRLR